VALQLSWWFDHRNLKRFLIMPATLPARQGANRIPCRSALHIDAERHHSS
jgi:hypothetical protein